MASYHFRIKSDKKSNGERVSASVHVDYIARQGRFKNEGAEQNSETNSISFSGENIFHDDYFPLYLSDDFGKIFNTPEGLKITGKYSPATLSIALTLAKNFSNDQPLILHGSQKFKNKILQSAVDAELDIKFADADFQNNFEKLLEMKKNDEQQFIQNGGKIFRSRHVTKSNFKKFNTRTILRWNLSAEQRNYSELTSKQILQNLDEIRNRVSASSHFEYINREKAFANRGDCIFTHHHLPSWAKNNPKEFFKAADKYEGKNRRRYVEIEFSLPNELTSVEDYKKIIDRFINLHLKNHYYTYAIHDKLGTFSGERHPHCHIMFSDRLIDDVEKIQERSPQNFFKRALLKKRDGSQPSFEEKFSHGAPKESHWNENPKNSKFIFQLREDFAKIQNDVLAEKGFSSRVDHRTLKAQKISAKTRKNYF